MYVLILIRSPVHRQNAPTITIIEYEDEQRNTFIIRLTECTKDREAILLVVSAE